MIDFNFSRFCFAAMMVVISGLVITINATTLTVSATTGIDNVTAIVIIVVVIVLTGGDPTQRTIGPTVTTIEFSTSVSDDNDSSTNCKCCKYNLCT